MVFRRIVGPVVAPPASVELTCGAKQRRPGDAAPPLITSRGETCKILRCGPVTHTGCREPCRSRRHRAHAQKDSPIMSRIEEFEADRAAWRAKLDRRSPSGRGSKWSGTPRSVETSFLLRT
jgi:hypothetical protein